MLAMYKINVLRFGYSLAERFSHKVMVVLLQACYPNNCSMLD